MASSSSAVDAALRRVFAVSLAPVDAAAAAASDPPIVYLADLAQVRRALLWLLTADSPPRRPHKSTRPPSTPPLPQKHPPTPQNPPTGARIRAARRRRRR